MSSAFSLVQRIKDRVGGMNAMAKGIAHLSFRGGGMFLPVRNPYDRQTLIDHVRNRVHIDGRAQVLVDDQRWMVFLKHDAAPVCCSCRTPCGDSACYSTAHRGRVFCLKCALENRWGMGGQHDYGAGEVSVIDVGLVSA